MTHENKITPHLYYVNTLPSKTQHIANWSCMKQTRQLWCRSLKFWSKICMNVKVTMLDRVSG